MPLPTGSTLVKRRASTRACSRSLPRGAIVTGSTCVMSPNKHVSSAAANNPIRIIFATCNRERSAVKRATNSPSRSAARITARSIALATSRPGGRRPASIQLGSPATSGGKPGLMIRKSQTSRVSLRARRLDQLPRHLTVRRSRGPITVFHPLKAVQTLEAYASEQRADSARTTIRDIDSDILSIKD